MNWRTFCFALALVALATRAESLNRSADPTTAAVDRLFAEWFRGTDFQYNNGAYNLFGNLVKKVSGQSLREFADANIFKPLGMSIPTSHWGISWLAHRRARRRRPWNCRLRGPLPRSGAGCD